MEAVIGKILGELGDLFIRSDHVVGILWRWTILYDPPARCTIHAL